MQFLYPQFLWALSALAVPLIIHLFNFRRYKTIYFSNVQFLKNIRKETHKRSQLKNLLILLARMVAIASLVMVFARPYKPVEKGIKSTKDPVVSVYIDNSFSMEGEGKFGILLEVAKKKAIEIAEGFPYNTQFQLITNEFELKHQPLVNRDQFVDWISQVKTTHVVRNLSEVLNRQKLLQHNSDTSSSGYLFLLSDFQKNTTDVDKARVQKNMRYFLVPFINSKTNNLFIDSVWFDSPGHYLGKTEHLLVSITNFSEEDYRNIPLQFFLNDTLKTLATFSIGANRSITDTLSFNQSLAGFNKAYVEITDYPITFDNKLYFNYYLRQKINVLGLKGKAPFDYFNALFQNDPNFNYQVMEAGQVQFNQFSSQQVIFVYGYQTLTSGLITELSNYVNKGGTLVFIPDGKGDVGTYNQLLQSVSGIKYGELINQKGSFKQLKTNNPIFDNVFRAKPDQVKLPGYSGYFRITLGSRSMASQLFESESGDPLFAKQAVRDGYVYVSALPVDPEMTDFATHPLFVALFYNLALQSAQFNELYYPLRTPLMATVQAGHLTNPVVSLKADDLKDEFYPEASFSNGQLHLFPDVLQLHAGTYDVINNKELIEQLSFNYDRRESKLEYYSGQEVQELFKQNGLKPPVILNSELTLLSREIERQAQGEDFGRWFLWLMLFALISEMLMIRFLK